MAIQDKNIEDYISFLRTDLVVAAKELLCSEPERPLTLWWGQRAILKAFLLCAFNMVIAGRGLGKSFMLAVYAILKCLLFPRHRIGVISASFRQAKFVFAEIKRIYQYSPILQNACLKPPVLASDMCYLEFKNGSIIMALPLGNGETIRGARFHTLECDEAVKVPEEILEVAVLPMMNVKKDPMREVERVAYKRRIEELGLEDLTNLVNDGATGNQIIFTTTAWFQFISLYKLYKEWKEEQANAQVKGIRSNYSVFEFPYTAAPDGFLDMNYVHMTKKTMSPVRFAMENLAFWPPDTDGFYPASIFERAKRQFPPKFQGDKDMIYILSVDPARESDNFIISVYEAHPRGGPSKLVYMESMGPKDFKTTDGFSEMHEKIRIIYHAFNPVRIMLDQGGGGLPLRDMLSKQYNFKYNGKIIQSPPMFQLKGQNDQHDALMKTESRAVQIIDLVSFSTEWLNDAAWELKSRLEQGNLLLPSAPRDADEKAQVTDTSGLYDNLLVDMRDIIYAEIEKAIEECTNIVHEELPSRKGYFRFTTPTKSQKKDRWASMVLGIKGLSDVEKEGRLVRPPISDSGVMVPEKIASFSGINNNQDFRQQHTSVIVGLDDVVEPEGVDSIHHNIRANPGVAALG